MEDHLPRPVLRFAAQSLRRLTLAVAAVSASAPGVCGGYAAAADWPGFRGPTANGLTSEVALPTSWSKDENVAWKLAIPGAAWSQPIVWKGKVYLTTAVTENQSKPSTGAAGGRGGRPGGGFGPPGAGGPPPGGVPGRPPRGEGPPGERPGGAPGGFGGGRERAPASNYQWKVICLDQATGKLEWEKVAHEGKPAIGIHRTNTYASETPVTDGERLYVYFGMTGLYCYDLAGKELWKKDLGTYEMQNGWGTGSSPAVDDKRLYIQCDNEEKSFLVALDKTDGKVLWQKDRDEKSNWSTPYLWKNKLRTELVTGGGNKMRSYNPETGELLWECGGGVSRCSATPVGNDDMLFVGTGGGQGSGPLLAIKAGAKGDISLSGTDSSSDFVAWSVERGGPPMASPLLYQGLLYVLDQRGGVITCYDAATGKQHYKERLPGATGFYSSPWACGDTVYVMDQEGTAFVLKAGPTLEVLQTNKLGEMFWSSVCVADGSLILRGIDNIYCIKP
ncbi:hypothetical protein Psta_1473 [Pirellula staleyi DSM 6068]|uniref:Pyrrolo-quinoline quinone repeat domain-containing protein n=1 Tax=Pirellula staleyi (strain ATCC 27377 / DSM 6068 / ICPB 4128) TaxID=530564 RepID=D2QXG3_PIRSD|nr:PQQ-binding-like beta-propeller repeat protein [Pirellula staleyi]ADB16148.1 hypothetical protein Psta_1473 [Pirellula staleyi DSM 6068]